MLAELLQPAQAARPARPRSGRRDSGSWACDGASWDLASELATAPASQAGLEVMVRHAAEGAGRLDPDPGRRGGEVGQRDLFDLDDLHRPRVRAGRDRALARPRPVLPRGSARRPSAPKWKIRSTCPLTDAMAAPTALAASKCSGLMISLTPGISSGTRMLPPPTAMSGRSSLGGLHPVDRLGQHRVGPGQRLGQQRCRCGPILARVAQLSARPAGHRGVGQRRRRPAEDQRLPRSAGSRRCAARCRDPPGSRRRPPCRRRARS